MDYRAPQDFQPCDWVTTGEVAEIFGLPEPIETDGLTYEDRNRLSRVSSQRMAAAMHELYGIDSDPSAAPQRESAAAD